jgi:holo-[acyl-carrier protein] synthase
MIRGIGTDIIEVDRIAENIESHGQRFLDRIFTPNEQEYCNQYRQPARHYAARWAAKEAVVKAFGTGFGKTASHLDVEVINDPRGKPEIRLADHLNEEFHNPQLLITLSHCDAYATATVIML